MGRDEIDTAMVLAAGFGKRLRPITDSVPKPLVQVGGSSMLDRTLDALVQAGIKSAVVNTHYLGEMIVAHCRKRTDINCLISDETGTILETGGGTVKALPLLGEKPFLVINADTFWLDFGESTIRRMVSSFDPTKMDIMLLLCRHENATGHTGGSDFIKGDDNRLMRSATDDPKGLIYAGAAIYRNEVFDGASKEKHSLNIYFDKAIETSRLFGHVLDDGHWFTVGTPEGLRNVERDLARISSDKID